MSKRSEAKYNRQGQVSSAIVLILALVFFAWNIFSKQNPPPPLEGIEVVAAGDINLGANDDANPRSEEEEIEQPSEPTPPEEPTPSDADVNKDVVTDDNSDAPPIKKDPKPKVKPKPKPKDVKPKEEAKPKEEPKKPKTGSLFNKDKDGKGKGDNDNPGPTGDGGEDDDGGTVGSVTTGGDIGGGLSGRCEKQK